MKNIKIEWCRNFIESIFTKIPFQNGGIEVNLFWDKAEKSGLWVRGTYGSSMSEALIEITKVESVSDEGGNYLYSVFRLV